MLDPFVPNIVDMRILLSLLVITATLRFPVHAAPGMAKVVTRGDAVIMSQGEGRDANGAPITADTPMRVASLSKSFTAAAVSLTLVEEGRIVLDDRSSPTSRSSGWPTHARPPSLSGSCSTRRRVCPTALSTSARRTGRPTWPDMSRRCGRAAWRRRPALSGDCNVNYDVAARLVEVVDGRPFREAMRERVFNPLGMVNSSIGGTPANGYISLFGVWIAQPELHGFRGGAGGGVTTAADMGRWLIARPAMAADPVGIEPAGECTPPGPLPATMPWDGA